MSSVTGRASRVAILAIAVLLAVVTTGFSRQAPQAQETGQPTLKESPPGEVLVTDANLLEAFKKDDVADPTDMRNFARRLTGRVPYAPDALLLQEVVGPSARNVARFMSEETGYRYEVAVAPGESAFVGGGTNRDTAIVLNMTTMRALDEGGFIRDEVGSKNKDHAYLLAKERRGGLRVPLVSVHLQPRPDFDSKGDSTRQIAAFVEQAYPSPANRQAEVVAGDFNNRRCLDKAFNRDEPYECRESPAYRVMTGDYGYTDAILAAGSPQDVRHEGTKRIDYIFTRGAVLAAASDLERNANFTQREFRECKALYNNGRGDEATGACATDFYSDHRFVYALVGMSDRPDTTTGRGGETSTGS